MSVAEFRRACRQYAERFVALQRTDFKRLLILGDWDKPYLTMNFAVPGGHRARARQVRRAGHGLQGQEAGALVHPLPHGAGRGRGRVRATTPRRRSTSSSRSIRPATRNWSSRVPEAQGREVSALIWTTTPWTIPSNLGDRVPPGLRVRAVRRRRPARRRRRGTRRAGRREDGQGARRRRSRRSQGACSSRSSSGTRSTTARRSACWPTTSRSTRARARCTRRPGHGADDYRTGVKYGLDIYAPVDGGGHFTPDVGAVRRACACSRRTRRSSRRSRERGRCGSTRRTSTSTRTAGAATTR